MSDCDTFGCIVILWNCDTLFWGRDFYGFMRNVLGLEDIVF